VATYALNRLPPLYASSQEGRRHQQMRGKQKYNNEISTAVRQAFAAVQRDPLRRSTPLTRKEEAEYQVALAVLEEIQQLLPHKKLSWHNLVNVVQQSLTKTASRGVGVHKRRQVGVPDASPAEDAWGDTRYHW